MPYKLAIFDFDGTLADTLPAFAGHFAAASEHFSFRSIQPEEIDALRQLSARQIIAHLGIPLWKLPLIARFIHRRMQTEVATLRLFPGADAMLRDLRAAGLTIAILSSNSEPNVRAILGPDSAALIASFECGAALFGKARRFRRILKQTGIAAAEAIYIGDEIRDHEAATTARIAFGAVTWGYTKPEALRKLHPTLVFTQLSDIAPMLAVQSN